MYQCILKLFRRKFSDFNDKYKTQLGMFLKEVQIDETYWSKAKYGNSRWSRRIWIWGAIGVKLGSCYLTQVKEGYVVRLIPIIGQHIKEKSYFVSDQWPTYIAIKRRYRYSVCHKYNFVDPKTRANMKKIENFWSHLKKLEHYSYGIS
ncbi:hypothetical protein DMUE_2156 [Dictyocoela muelleri]|nr:hypothetical protein DMUE_2156 [Dictyocoela muelleri]